MNREEYQRLAGAAVLAAAAVINANALRRGLTVAAGTDLAGIVATLTALGLGVGTALSAFFGRGASTTKGRLASSAALLFTLTAPATMATAIHLAAGTFPARWDRLLAYTGLAILPSLFAGLAFGESFKNDPTRTTPLFAVVAAGATVGFLVTPGLTDLGGVGALAIGGACAAAVATACFSWPAKIKTFGGAGVAVAAIACGIIIPPLFQPAPSAEKFLSKATAVEKTEWGTDGRAELCGAPADIVPAGALAVPKQYWLTVDGGRPTPAASASATGFPDAVRQYLVAFACQIKPPAKALVIGGGIGDALAVAATTRAAVDAVVDDASAELIAFSQNRDNAAGKYKITFWSRHGRQFLRRRPVHYDLILLATGVAGLGPVDRPAYAPEYLLTTEAFAEFYRRLNPGGVVVFAAYDKPPARFFYNAAAAAAAGLTHARPEGTEAPVNPALATLILRDGDVVCAVIKKGNFSELEVAAVAGSIPPGYQPVYLPRSRPAPEARAFAAFLNGLRDVPHPRLPLPQPSTDDRPFPTSTARGRDLLAAVSLTVPVALIFLAWPAIHLKKNYPYAGAKVPLALYFTSAAVALAAIAFPLTVQTGFYLGGSGWQGGAATATLAAVIAGGALLSGRLGRWRRWLPFAVAAGATFAFALLGGFIYGATAAWATVIRIYVTIVVVAAVGAFAGVLFALGLAAAAARERALTPWLVGVGLSALAYGGLIAPAVARALGMRLLTTIAALLYLIAWSTFRWASGRGLPPVQARADDNR